MVLVKVQTFKYPQKYQKRVMNEDGTFLLVDYLVKVKDTGETVYTTSEEEAKKAGIFNEREIYKPELIIIGSNEVTKGFEKALRENEVGQEKEVEIPPEEGYGQRDLTKVKVFSIKRLAEKNVNVEEIKVGSSVEVDGKIGIVRAITSGRVTIDFNPPLAGKTLVYKFKILKKIEDDKEKIVSLLGRWFPRIDESKFEVNLSDSEVTIKIPPEIFYVEGLQLIKRTLFSSVTKYVPKVERVVFIEAYEKEKPKEEKKEEKSEETKQAEPQ
jgi:peptidylprolyl isomerase